MSRNMKLLGAVAAALIGFFLLWQNVLNRPDKLALSPLSYSDFASWSVVPKEAPPAVWQAGWNIDVFLIDQAAELSARTGAQLDKREQQARLQGRSLEDAFSKLGTVYAPLFREEARNDDLTRAFQLYLKQQNRGRAFVIVAGAPVPSGILDMLRSDAILRARFGGFYVLETDDLTPANALEASGVDAGVTTGAAYCDAHLVDDGTCIVPLQVSKSHGLLTLAENSGLGADPAGPFLAWLESNAQKIAEPLGDLEEVEIIDIRRPGDTDERRDDSDDN